MERILLKTGLYTFLVTLSLNIIFVPDSYHSSLNGTTYTVPLRQYILEVLRYSLTFSLIVTALVAIILAIRFFRKKH